MSYGWLTESSLIPRPAAPIAGVSDKSLSTLKSFMLEKEQETKKRRAATGLTTAKPTKKFRSHSERKFADHKNAGVDKRNERDAKMRADSDASALRSFEASRKKLEEKAKIYESIRTEDTASILNKVSDKKGVDPAALCLDIDRKRRLLARKEQPHDSGG